MLNLGKILVFYTFDFVLFKDWVSLIKDILTGLSALSAPILALLGYRAWKIQLRGKTEYDLAKKYLMSIYKLRNTIIEARNPIVNADEINKAMQEIGLADMPINDKNYSIKENYAVYKNRFQKINVALLDFENINLEAELFWGNIVNDHMKLLREHIWKLHQSKIYDLYFMEGKIKKIPVENYDSIIYSNLDDPSKDEYLQELHQRVQKIEVFVKPRLKLEKL